MKASLGPTTALITAVCASLQDGIDAANTVTAEQYSRRHPEVDAESIGAHLRHHIEHVELLLEGLESGTVDYDARRRDLEMERNPAVAIARCRVVMERVARLNANDLACSLRLTQQTDPGSDAKVELQTTMGRELLFMHSHAVHHHAIIAMLLRAFGRRMASEFGVMPSTTVWRQRNSD